MKRTNVFPLFLYRNLRTISGVRELSVSPTNSVFVEVK